jgi:acyl dehydratase
MVVTPQPGPEASTNDAQPRDSAPRTFASTAALTAETGTLLGPTQWRKITQHDINVFGDITGDRQWIHTDPIRAAAGPFGTTIAHGYLTLSLAGSFVPQLLAVPSASSILNYGLDKVRFLTPVSVDSSVRAKATLAKISTVPGGVDVSLNVVIEIEAGTKPACIVEALLRYLD